MASLNIFWRFCVNRKIDDYGIFSGHDQYDDHVDYIDYLYPLNCRNPTGARVIVSPTMHRNIKA